MPRPWTETLSLGWRPTLNFWERRLQLLRAFDKVGLLGHFRVEEDEVGARPRGTSDEVRVTAGTARFASAEANYEFVQQAVAIVLQTIEPGRLSQFHTYHQFIVPISGSYNAVRLDAALRLFGDFAKSTGTTDWALLMDMERQEGLGQVEFGIVEKGEISDRITRRTGRMLTGSSVEIPAAAVSQRALPDVALFADYNWGASKLPQDGGERWVMDQLNRVRNESEKFVGGLVQALALSSDASLRGEGKA